MNIGLIGVGSIGTFLIEQINQEKTLPGYHVAAIYDERNKSNPRRDKLAKEHDIIIYQDLFAFLNAPIDLVIECANIEAVEKYATDVIREKDLLLISVGALVDTVLHDRIRETALHYNRKVYLPSGAIGGLDVLRAANELNGLESVTLVTRKPNKALSMETSSKEMTVFEGTAKEAIVNFPKNANIAIILSLSGLGVEKTKVKIIADPLITKNIHQLEATGDFGKLVLTLENKATPDNPKTSYLTALSILSTLRSLEQAIIIK